MGWGGFIFLSSFNLLNLSFLHSDRIVLEDEFRDTWLCGKIWKRRWSNQNIKGIRLQSSLEAAHAHMRVLCLFCGAIFLFCRRLNL